VKFSEKLIFDHFFDLFNFIFDTETTIQVEKYFFSSNFCQAPLLGIIMIKKIETITSSYRAEIFFSYPLFFKKLRQNNSKCEGEKFFLINFV
jgi:hypothetical protein